MNQEQNNRLSASFYRQMFYLKMMGVEQNFFLKIAKHSGVKNVLHRMKNSNASALEQLAAYMPNSRDKVKEIMSESEEKIYAMANIIEKISMLDEETVLKLEKDFDEHIKIDYAG